MDVEELIAREQIRDALARYARGVDRLDLDLVLSVFHPDAVDHHGRSVGRPADIFPEIFARLRGLLAASHLLCSSTMTFPTRTQAVVETYAIGFHRLPGPPRPRDLRIGLRYADRFECRAGEWRVAERHVLEDWRRVDDVDPATPAGAFEPGSRDRSDRSYRLGG